MNQELRIKKLIKFFKKVWHFISRHNAFIIALELAIFVGIVFAFIVSNYNPLNKQFTPEGILPGAYGTGNQQLAGLEELKEQEKELGEHHRILTEARATLKPEETKEVIKLRNETSKTYVSGEKKVIWEGSIGPIHYQDNPNDPNGEWKEIDTTIEQTNGQYQVTKTPYKATFLTQPGYIYQSKDVEGDWIQVKLEGLESWNSSSRVINNNKITYSNVFTDTDAEITTGNTGVQLNLILQSPQAPTEFSFDIESGNSPKNGLNWQSFSMRDLTGYDAEGKPLDIDWNFNQKTGKIVLAVDTTDAVYPLTVDPTVDKQVGTGADDGCSEATWFYPDETYFRMGDYWGSAYNGYVRWTGVTIEGTIDTSYIEIYYKEASGNALLKVYGVDEDDPAAPTTYQEYWADPLTDAGDPGINWDGAWSGTWNQSPSLNIIFQELVDTYTISDDAVMVQIRDDGSAEDNGNTGYSYEHSDNTYGPTLHIEYTLKALGESCSSDGECTSDNCQFNVCCESSATGDRHCWAGQVGADSDDCTEKGDLTYYESGDGGYDKAGREDGGVWDSGWRWTDVTVSEGATIDVAYFEGYGSFLYAAYDPNMKIAGIDQDNCSTFSSSNRPSQQTRTTAKTDWDPTGWGTSLGWEQSPSLVDEIAEITSRASWASGNALGIVIWNDNSPTFKCARFKDFDADSSKAGKLYIEYTPPLGGSCDEHSDCDSGNCQHNVCCKDTCIDDCHCWGGQVGVGGDDGRRYTGTEGFSASETVTAVLGYFNNSTYQHGHVFARWTGVTIAGTINVSHIQYWQDTTGSGTAQLKVYGINEDNPAAPITAAQFDADPLTDAGVDWDGAWTTGAWNQSLSLNAVFQELVDSYTIENEAVMVQIKNDGGAVNRYNVPRMWEYSGNLHGAKLYIEYTPAGAEERRIIIIE